MSAAYQNILDQAQKHLSEWLSSCTRRGKLSRNTIAVGVVALHHLRVAKTLPLERDSAVTKGGEMKLSRGSKFRELLQQYGVGERYLKEVTTRQAHQDGQRLLDALQWGELLTPLSPAEREEVLDALLNTVLKKAQEQLQRESVRLRLDQNLSPWAWIRQILDATRDRSFGIVEQHLVGAKLEARFPNQNFPTLPAHAADAPTRRSGDFELSIASGKVVFHVTARPSSTLIQKCRENLENRLLPVILTSREKEANAIALAEDQGIAHQIAVLPIEHFVATNLIEFAAERNISLMDALKAIVEAYNRRVDAAETNLSCKIELE